ncbi:MAG: YkvA family protein [Thermomicrobiales bacterium]
MNEQLPGWEQDDLPDDEALSDRVKETARRGPRYMKLVVGMVRDPDVPMKAKAALILGGSYVVSPIDLIPGLIPVFGQIDDLVVMMAALGTATKLTPPDLVQKHLDLAGLTSADMKRDAETAELAGRWALAKGYSAAKAVAAKSMAAAYRATRRGYTMLSERVGSR